ncbi:hypothetical protein SOCE26_033390 [Sorangium cellulosum]|uniref:Cytochrome c domain-containing protein n=1 Tax=Sorangium cellulosum TaxID=56 RepID=A0A2L0ERK5_SORCE|nr:hypothetical protein [Sorangium cellulosum]AUX41914.1 hypothetical protein SOCE26_033390 [Sorangium cellulosum]
MGEPAVQPIDGPPVRLIEARATTSLDQNYQPVRTALDPSGATTVLSTSSFVLKFDRFLLPSAVGAALGHESVCLSADLAAQVKTYADCLNPIALTPSYNPVRREVTFRQVEGMPRLLPGTRYALTVLAPVDEAASAGIRAFDGAPLGANVRLEFTVAAMDPPETQPERPPSGDFFCQRDLECVSGMCQDDPVCTTCVRGAALYLWACAGCHGDADTAVGLNLDVGMTFNRLDPLHATAIGHAAHQTQMGERAHVGEHNPERFGTAMPLIDPGDPGNSYLLYKIIVGQNAVDPLLSPDQAEQVRAEIERLRGAFVMGLPMPPPKSNQSFRLFSEDPNDPLLVPHVDGTDILTAWILDGAKTRDCTAAP